MNILCVFLWLVKQYWCEAILEQMSGSTCLGRGGAFSDFERTVSQRQNTWMSVGVNSLMEIFLQKSWYFVCSQRRWSDLLCSRRCLHDHPHQTLEKETQYTPQLVKTVAKEIMKVESSKQIRSQTCCSVTIDSKSHLVAPAVSTDYPVIQEDAHRRLSQEEQRTLDLTSEEERVTARTMVSRLHVELGHSDPRDMIDSLR